MRKLLLTLALVVGVFTMAEATITVPNVFVPFTTISSSAVNSNFSTLAEAALNRHGDNIDGNITVTGGVTIDGADISAFLQPTGKIISTSAAADAVKVTGGVTAGSGNVAIIGTDGRIPSFTSTFFASLTLPAANIVGILPLQQYTETQTAPTISGGVLTVDMSLGTYFTVALNANITTVTITNPPASGKTGTFTLVFTGDGTQRTISWPASVKWPSAANPTPTSTAGKVDVYSFITFDGGTTYFAFLAAQNS